MVSLDQLRENVALARDFKPLPEPEQKALVDKVREVAGDGRFELFKSSQTFDGPHHRKQHGFRA
jgi:hypothetical protein